VVTTAIVAVPTVSTAMVTCTEVTDTTAVIAADRFSDKRRPASVNQRAFVHT